MDKITDSTPADEIQHSHARRLGQDERQRHLHEIPTATGTRRTTSTRSGNRLAGPYSGSGPPRLRSARSHIIADFHSRLSSRVVHDAPRVFFIVRPPATIIGVGLSLTAQVYAEPLNGQSSYRRTSMSPRTTRRNLRCHRQQDRTGRTLSRPDGDHRTDSTQRDVGID